MSVFNQMSAFLYTHYSFKRNFDRYFQVIFSINIHRILTPKNQSIDSIPQCQEQNVMVNKNTTNVLEYYLHPVSNCTLRR